MSDVDTLIEKIKAVFDGDVSVDENSADEAGEQKDFAHEWLTHGALVALSNNNGIPGVMNDSQLGPWFREKTTKIKVLFDNDVSSDVLFKWDDKTLSTRWGRGIFRHSQNTTLWLLSNFRNCYRNEEKKQRFINEVVPGAEDTIARTFGPGKGFEIEVDWDSFAVLDDADAVTNRLIDSNGYYSVRPITDAVYHIATYEDDCIVDGVAGSIKSVTIALEPGTDADKKSYSYDKKGNLTLKLCFEISGWSGIFSREEIMPALLATGLADKPEYKTFLLSSVCSTYRVRSWGWLDHVKDLIDPTDGLFYKTSEEQLKAVGEKSVVGNVVKYFGNVQKVNRRGKKQPRGVLITTERFYTAEMSGGSIKDKNFRVHTLKDIMCIDIYPMGKIGDKPFGVTVWSNEVEEKKPGLFGKMKLPGVKLPGIKLPGIKLPNMPKVDLPDMPKVDLPDLPDLPDMPDMPDMPKLPSFDLSMPEMFKRHKEPKPKRYHPQTKGVQRPFDFVANDLSTSEGNLLMEELAWVFYAAWCAETRSSHYEPFYLKEKKVFETSEQIEDNRPKIEKE